MKLAMLMRDDPNSNFNGLSTYCREITKALKKRGHEVEWFIGRTDWKTLRLGKKIPDSFELVYAVSLPYGAMVKLPMVAKCNSPLKEEGRYYPGLKRITGFLGQYAEVATLSKAKAVVSVSQVSHDILKEKYWADSTVVPDGVDLEEFRPSKRSDGKVFVNWCGRMDDPRKNIEPYLDLYDLFKEEVEFRRIDGSVPHELAIAGLNMTDIFISTSKSEAFNISLLEAMASGCACIASDIPAHRELIEDGLNGLLFHDEEGMKVYLDHLIDGPGMRTSLGIKARKKAENYTWENSAEKLEKVFESVVN